ncbi:MAG: helix-turn-helix transcriptional regulator [Planctomycetes bacterium]|nr:helix-turn-helix transcriptional regulator [Planctomycetota bacterium]
MAERRLPSLNFASDLRLPRDWALPAHAHVATHELVLVVEGTVETRIAGKAMRAGAGIAKLHPSGVSHAEATVAGARTRLLFLHWPQVAGDGVDGWPLQAADRTGRLRAVFEWLVELTAREAGSTSTSDALLQGLLHEYLACATDEDPDLAKARSWAVQHLDEPIVLADLARVAGMSRFHFARAFHRATGVPPMRWLRARRVEAARALLLSTTLPLRAIAPQVGFADEFALSRAVRQVAGTGARALRRR